MKIVQIDGFKGLLTVTFIGVCLFAGFVIFPGLVAMYLWNSYFVSDFMFPTLNLFQGVLLWGMVVVSYAIFSKNGLAVSFKDAPELSDVELDMIMKKAKISSQLRHVNNMINKSDKFEKSVVSKPDLHVDKDDLKLVKSSDKTKDDDVVSNLK